MSIKYSIAELKNPIRREEPAKFFAKAQTRAEVDLNRISQEIAYASSLTRGDVLNVLSALIDKIKEHLADGDMVSLGDFGKFQYQISCKGADTIEEFTRANIRNANIRFRPGTMIKDELSTLKFERVLSVKARKQAAKGQ